MINKNTLSTLLHALLKKKKVHTYSKQTLYPRRDWLIGILGFSLLVVLGAGYTVYTFNTYQNIHTSVVADVQPLEGYKENTVAKVLAAYREKKALFGAKLASPSEPAETGDVVLLKEPQATTTQESVVASTTPPIEPTRASSSTSDVAPVVEAPILE